MSEKFISNHDQYIECLRTVNQFFYTFPRKEAHKLLHKMIRAALAKKEILDKEEILDLLLLKEYFEGLIESAGILSGYDTIPPKLKKLFQKRTAGEWKETLDELFRSAAYDGLFTTEPDDDDIYHTYRGLFKMVDACCDIHVPEFG